MFQLLATGLVLIGMAVLGRSVLLNHKLVKSLPAGRLRNRWRAMMAMVAAFIGGYAGYLAIFSGGQHDASSMVVPIVFFLGAGYVWLTAKLALETADGVRRIAELEQENISDPLTGLFNRRYLDQRLAEEFARAERYDTPLSVMLLDLDHFKSINDAHGHHAGDLVLQAFAETIRSALRESDFVARYGGEEFVVVAPHTSPADAKTLAERLRVLIAGQHVTLPAEFDLRQPINTTVSIGVASRGDGFERPEEIVRAADSCLYRAKRLGRNRVATADAKEHISAEVALGVVSAA